MALPKVEVPRRKSYLEPTACRFAERDYEGPVMTRGPTASTDAGRSNTLSTSPRSWETFQTATRESIEECVEEVEEHITESQSEEVEPLVVMVRNLWCKCTPQMLADILMERSLCHKEVYVPIRKSEKRVPTNHGYGFVTLTCQEDLEALYRGLDNVDVDFGNTVRTLSLTHAHAHCDMQERRPWCLWPQPALAEA
eukprot:CAMPEP_0206582506 /NCGR_PEP_ID=MMETSP0325_2-20121206/34522_1 /ASSEMBLY_ACC=CAM_ASM_000347 /TAXON_ID=2866 /ORGANISM="Crypthecodinium cohnii, Strain Seligo" /LENGTH=195 /DNA_ID=CAMNT_0054089195 /DNA_START=191 /DNA_END=778 /DNA_ORIENTATION=+